MHGRTTLGACVPEDRRRPPADEQHWHPSGSTGADPLRHVPRTRQRRDRASAPDSGIRHGARRFHGRSRMGLLRTTAQCPLPRHSSDPTRWRIGVLSATIAPRVDDSNTPGPRSHGRRLRLLCP